MKKIVAILLAVMCCAVSGCAGKSAQDAGGSDSPVSSVTQSDVNMPENAAEDILSDDPAEAPAQTLQISACELLGASPEDVQLLFGEQYTWSREEETRGGASVMYDVICYGDEGQSITLYLSGGTVERVKAENANPITDCIYGMYTTQMCFKDLCELSEGLVLRLDDSSNLFYTEIRFFVSGFPDFYCRYYFKDDNYFSPCLYAETGLCSGIQG